MKSSLITAARLVSGTLCLIWIALGCSNHSGEGKLKPQTHTVEIRQMVFNPAIITVSKGDSIRFINHDIVAHDVTEQISKSWSSQPLQPQQGWTMVATKSADYYCSIHQVMKGKIIVK